MDADVESASRPSEDARRIVPAMRRQNRWFACGMTIFFLSAVTFVLTKNYTSPEEIPVDFFDDPGGTVGNDAANAKIQEASEKALLTHSHHAAPDKNPFNIPYHKKDLPQYNDLKSSLVDGRQNRTKIKQEAILERWNRTHPGQPFPDRFKHSFGGPRPNHHTGGHKAPNSPQHPNAHSGHDPYSKFPTKTKEDDGQGEDSNHNMDLHNDAVSPEKTPTKEPQDPQSDQNSASEPPPVVINPEAEESTFTPEETPPEEPQQQDPQSDQNSASEPPPAETNPQAEKATVAPEETPPEEPQQQDPQSDKNSASEPPPATTNPQAEKATVAPKETPPEEPQQQDPKSAQNSASEPPPAETNPQAEIATVAPEETPPEDPQQQDPQSDQNSASEPPPAETNPQAEKATVAPEETPPEEPQQQDTESAQNSASEPPPAETNPQTERAPAPTEEPPETEPQMGETQDGEAPTKETATNKAGVPPEAPQDTEPQADDHTDKEEPAPTENQDTDPPGDPVVANKDPSPTEEHQEAETPSGETDTSGASALVKENQDSVPQAGQTDTEPSPPAERTPQETGTQSDESVPETDPPTEVREETEPNSAEIIAEEVQETEEEQVNADETTDGNQAEPNAAQDIEAWHAGSVSTASGMKFEIVEELHHDHSSFTQGLTFANGKLYESAGLYGASTIRVLDPSTGDATQIVKMESKYFAEGMTFYKDKLVQITWKLAKGFVYDANDIAAAPTEYTYTTTKHNEGWGITYDNDRDELIVTDGSGNLMFWDPDCMQSGHCESKPDKLPIEVTRLDGKPARNLNEIEYWRGRVIANIWYSDVLLVIHPETGKVEKEYGESWYLLMLANLTTLYVSSSPPSFFLSVQILGSSSPKAIVLQVPMFLTASLLLTTPTFCM